MKFIFFRIEVIRLVFFVQRILLCFFCRIVKFFRVIFGWIVKFISGIIYIRNIRFIIVFELVVFSVSISVWWIWSWIRIFYRIIIVFWIFVIIILIDRMIMDCVFIVIVISRINIRFVGQFICFIIVVWCVWERFMRINWIEGIFFVEIINFIN